MTCQTDARHHSQAHRAPASWSAALAEFEAWLDESNRSAATTAGYMRHVTWLSAAAEHAYADPWEISPEFLGGWLLGQRWSQETRRKVLVSLRAFYAYGLHEGLCQRSPLVGLVGLPPRRRSGPEPVRAALAWQEPLAAFEQHLQAGARSAGTREQRRWWLMRLGETYADPWSVKLADLEKFLAREDWSPSTKRLGRSSVREFYAWAERTERIRTSPARHLPVITTPRAFPRPAPDDAVAIALSRADDRVRLALYIGLYAGLRRAEIARLHTRDLAPDHLRVLGKGNRERRVPLHPDLHALIRAELRRRHLGTDLGTGWGSTVPDPDGWLFPSNHGGHLTPHHLGKLIARALPPGWTTHTLRHRFATQAYATHRDLRAVQEILGHAKPETTAVYAAAPRGAVVDAVASISVPPPAQARHAD